MLTKILVPTDGYQSSIIATEYATDIARFFDAEIMGISVIDTKRLTAPLIHDLGTSIGGMVPFGQFRSTLEEMLTSVADSALVQLEEACKEKGVKYSLKKEEGVIAREITKHAKDAELIAMGRTGEHTKWADGLLGSNLESVVRLTHKPILVASEDHMETTKILVAYDGSKFAEKALKMGGELANKMQIPITILTVSSDADDASKIISGALEHIKPFDVDHDSVVASGDPVDVIFNKYKDGHFNMLVMGAYGHSKIRELIVGSTTVRLMRKVKCPLLISR